MQPTAMARQLRIGRPRIECAQPEHISVFFKRIDARDAGVETAGCEITETTARIEHMLAARIDQGNLALCIILMPSISNVGASHSLGTSLISEPENLDIASKSLPSQ